MPDKTFLEQYPLYRRFRVERMPNNADDLPKPAINMACPKCASHQTFLMTNESHELLQYTNFPVAGITFRAVYVFTHCQDFQRVFYVKVDEKKQWFMKVGQFPSWEAEGEPNLEKLLGEHAEYFRKGLVCESQGYGIGAFGYYRRIVEEVIDGLLGEISGLMSGDDLKQFSVALEKTKKTIVTQEKIELVKDLLPLILRPDGMNPLSVLHTALSEGLHAESDETCLEHAGVVREVLVFLVNQVAASQAASKSFSDSMRRLLDRKRSK
ncbi:MAG: hypothetical protein Q7W02_11730 [Candidatus Rokubacteria bacterium]|nr:hypothetical protein [Candidatus Rokubacteria bacterium]